MFIKQGQLYVPNYDQIFDILAPAPFLRIQAASSNRFLYPLPTPGPVSFGQEDLPTTARMNYAEFMRKRANIFGRDIVVWECTNDGR